MEPYFLLAAPLVLMLGTAFLLGMRMPRGACMGIGLAVAAALAAFMALDGINALGRGGLLATAIGAVLAAGLSLGLLAAAVARSLGMTLGPRDAMGRDTRDVDTGGGI